MKTKIYKKKSSVIQAVQWFKNGDHPEDGIEVFEDGEFKGELLEGKVVRYYRTPELDGKQLCIHCGYVMHEHGWLDTGKRGHVVCPGDFIITNVNGDRFPCKPEIFNKKYEEVVSLAADDIFFKNYGDNFIYIKKHGETSEAISLNYLYDRIKNRLIKDGII